MPRLRPGQAPIALLVAPALALGVAACGDDPVAVERRELRRRGHEYWIVPNDVRVRQGRLRIVATNIGRLTHNVKVVKRDPDDLEAPPTEIGGTRTAQPGDSVPVTLTLEPGEYRLACTIANHDDLGQYGTLVVSRGEE